MIGSAVSAQLTQHRAANEKFKAAAGRGMQTPSDSHTN